MGQSRDDCDYHPLLDSFRLVFLSVCMVKNRRNITLKLSFGKKGMEVWQLILLILAVLLLVFVIAWYSGLNTQIADFLQKMSDML